MERSARLFVAAGAFSCAIGVLAGAFGAHALSDSVTPERVTIFKTAANYQLIHSIGIVFVGLASRTLRSPVIQWAGFAFLAGVPLFSGSLYTLVLADAAGFGAITPLGGLAFLGGWLLLAIGALKGDGP